jgi:hypothetical protein
MQPNILRADQTIQHARTAYEKGLLIAGLALIFVAVACVWPSLRTVVSVAAGLTALVLLVGARVCTPNPMHRLMDFLACNIEGFQMELNEVFQKRESPMDSHKDFTITFKGRAHMRELQHKLEIYFRDLGHVIKSSHEGKSFIAGYDGTVKGYEYQVYVRAHERLHDTFRVRVSRI